MNKFFSNFQRLGKALLLPIAVMPIAALMLRFGVLRLIKLTVEAAHREGIIVGICGEAAAEGLLIPYMIGLGIDELSMSAISILKAKEIISKWTVKEAAEIVNTVIGLENNTKIMDFLEKIKK